MPSPKQLEAYSFKPGNPGGGRPLGSRNRLTEVAIRALGDDFALHGVGVIEKVRKTKPHVYLQIIASLLPRQVSIEKLSPFEHLSDDELPLLEETLRAGRAREVNGEAVAVEPDKPSDHD